MNWHALWMELDTCWKKTWLQTVYLEGLIDPFRLSWIETSVK